YLKTVHLPSTLIKINSYAFQGCIRLDSPALPDALTEIGYRAFKNCDSFKQIVIPNNVTTIGGEAFQACDQLSQVSLPVQWTKAGSSIFASCPELRKLTVPNGITALPDSAFENANEVRMVLLPESLVKVGSYAFQGCSKLRYVVLPEKTVSVGYRAFRNAPLLESLTLRSDTVTFGGEAFEGFGDLTIYGWANSNVALYAIENGIPFVPFDELAADYRGYALDMSVSGITSEKNVAQIGESIPVTLSYTVKSDVFSTLKSMKLTIAISNNLTLKEDSLLLGGTVPSGYSYAGNLLTIPVSSKSGTLTFQVVPEKGTSIAIFAQLAYSTDVVQKVDILGGVYLDMEPSEVGYAIRYLGNDDASAAFRITNNQDTDIQLVIVTAAYTSQGAMTAVRTDRVRLTPYASVQTKVPCSESAAYCKILLLDPVAFAPQRTQYSLAIN
ncbi:MAG: leucine-rich repeat protein, partial [Clostridia bacterium]|nr:leucine-rich repeat protein [Clostridia bacterium]